MSNHNLFIHGANGVAEPVTSEQILGAARQVLSHRVRRGGHGRADSALKYYILPTVKQPHILRHDGIRI